MDKCKLRQDVTYSQNFSVKAEESMTRFKVKGDPQGRTDL